MINSLVSFINLIFISSSIIFLLISYSKLNINSTTESINYLKINHKRLIYDSFEKEIEKNNAIFYSKAFIYYQNEIKKCCVKDFVKKMINSRDIKHNNYTEYFYNKTFNYFSTNGFSNNKKIMKYSINRIINSINDKDFEYTNDCINNFPISSKPSVKVHDLIVKDVKYIKHYSIFNYSYLFESEYIINFDSISYSYSDKDEYCGIVDSVGNYLKKTSKACPQFTINNDTNKVIVSHVVMSNKGICSNITEYENEGSEIFFKNKEYFEVESCSSLGEYKYNLHYKHLSTDPFNKEYTYKDLYDENSLSKAFLNKNFLNKKINFYYSYYIGWKLDCSMPLRDIYNYKINTSEIWKSVKFYIVAFIIRLFIFYFSDKIKWKVIVYILSIINLYLLLIIVIKVKDYNGNKEFINVIFECTDYYSASIMMSLLKKDTLSIDKEIHIILAISNIVIEVIFLNICLFFKNLNYFYEKKKLELRRKSDHSQVYGNTESYKIEEK